MKQGRTINELATEIARQQKSKQDFLLPVNKINPYAHNGALEIAFELGNDQLFSGGFTNTGHQQIGQYCNIPVKYYDLMKTNSAELLATNVKHWLNLSSDRRMVRALDGNVRAFLSDKYRRLDNYDLAQHILPLFIQKEATVESCEVTETNLYIKAVTHKVQAEVLPGDVVSAGVMIRNSEVGHGALSIKPFIYRLVCKNGAVVDNLAMRKYHAGRRNDDFDQIEFKQDTQISEDKTFWLKVRDLVEYSTSEVTFKKIVESMKESTKRKVEQPQVAVELVAKAHKLNDDEQSNILTHLINGGDLSSWGLGNAVTRAAHDVESYDRSTELESIGYQIMQRNWN